MWGQENIGGKKMHIEIYRYTFKDSVPAEEIEGTMLLSFVASESLHGQARVRLDASYCFEADKRVCVVDATTNVGQDLCSLFTGFCIREFGEDSFKVARVSDQKNSAP
jgi:hypothetical protein